MGAIWRAVHTTQRVPVAIKVIRGIDGDHDFQDAFLHEVRLVAGLDHPNVVMLFDYGLVDKAAADSAGSLIAGSPYLAMELALGGSLAGVRSLPWSALRHVLCSLLDALGHAHARGIVHRDIKPGNLLLAGARSAFPSAPTTYEQARVVLSDFGISRDAERDDRYEGSSVGTPAYMSPEQVNASWRDQGPWTDLYAVGVLAWRLSAGRTVFHGLPQFQLLMAHLTRPVPNFEAAHPVPDGFEDWLRVLLAKNPIDRFQFAADAKRGLLSLGDPRAARGPGLAAVDDDELPTERLASLNLPLPEASGAAVTPSFQATRWRDADPVDFRLVGTGLGLYGLRQVPMVGRVRERDALWEALLRVRTSGVGAAVVLEGATGNGKSRLVRWLSETAHEVGAAATLVVRHGVEREAEHGLARCCARWLRADGLDADALIARVRVQLGALAADDTDLDLAQLVAPSLFPERSVLTRRRRHRAVTALLQAVGRGRAVLLWADDVQWSQDTLAFLQGLVLRQARQPFPVLIVLTVRDEALPDCPVAAELLVDLVGQEGVQALDVGPLPQGEHRELVRNLLGLEGSLAVTVESRTAGNPQFAVQLVGDWITRGLLEPSERGFRLRRGVTPDIPGDLLTVWEARLGELLLARAGDDAEALELAAVFGLQVAQRDWREACLLAGLRPSLDLLGELMAQRLAQVEDERGERWSLAHGMLREALVRRAKHGGRWSSHNLVVATALAQRGQPDPGRLAQHLLAAERPAQATAPLIQHITDQLDAGDYRSSQDLKALEGALEAQSLPRSDAHWGELWLLWAWLFRVRGANEDAERWAIRAERAARRHGWPEHLPRALREGGRVALNLGHHDAAVELLEEAAERYQTLEDTARARNCQVVLGDAWLRQGEADKAKACYRQGIVPNDQLRGRLALAFAVGPWMGLAAVARHTGALDDVARCLDRALALAERGGQQQVMAQVSNMLGEVARSRGELDLAVRHYREAARRYRIFDDADAVLPTLNLGLVLVDRGAHADAYTVIDALLAELERSKAQPIFVCYARVVLLPASAGTARWAALGQHLDWLEAFVARSGVVDKDIASAARTAAGLALRGRRFELARRGFGLAQAQLLELGKQAEAAEIAEVLAQLG